MPEWVLIIGRSFVFIALLIIITRILGKNRSPKSHFLNMFLELRLGA